MHPMKHLMNYPSSPFSESKQIKPTENKSKPGPLPATESVSNASRLLDKYRECYLRKYGQPALILNVERASELLKPIIASLGLPRSMELMEHFLTMTADTWFLKEGHTILIFAKRAEEIHANCSLTRKSTSSTGQTDPEISFETRCPFCDEWHQITCLGSEAHKHAYTTKCKKCI